MCDPKPCPNYSHEKIILGSWLQLLLTELYEILSAGLLCTIGSHSVPLHQGLGQAVRLLLLLLPLLLLFLSCPEQGHVFEAGHSVPLRWLFGPSLQLFHLCWHRAAAEPLHTSCPQNPAWAEHPSVLGGCLSRTLLSTVTTPNVQHWQLPFCQLFSIA